MIENPTSVVLENKTDRPNSRLLWLNDESQQILNR